MSRQLFELTARITTLKFTIELRYSAQDLQAVLRLIKTLRELFVLICERNQLRIAASRSPPPSFLASAIYSPDTKFRGPKSTAHLQGQSTSIKLPGGAHLSSGSSDYRKRPESHPTNLLLSLTVAEMILRVPVGRVERVRTSG